MNEKRCNDCGKVKDINLFGKSKNGKLGRRAECKECAKRLRKQRDSKNREKLNKYARNYRKTCKKEVKDNINKTQNKYYHKRIKNDELYKLTITTRNLIRQSFRNKGYSKKSKTRDIIGCSFEYLKLHLTKTFEDRYKIPIEQAKEKLHIDHIIPLSSAKTPEKLLELNHYSNLQYLYESDNLKKGNKINYEIELDIKKEND